MFAQAAAGQAPAEIAKEANARGWRTKVKVGRRTGKEYGGNPWTARQVLATLRNPVYTGVFQERESTRSGCHEPIITTAVFDAVAAQLRARRTRVPGQVSYGFAWPLKGLIRCAVCDRPMTPHTVRHRNCVYRYYRCRSTAGGWKPCGTQVSAGVLEHAVLQ